MKILFIVPYMPNEVRVRPYNFVRTMLARGHSVTVVALYESDAELTDGEKLRQLGAVVEAFPLSLTQKLKNLLSAALAGDPLQARFCWQPEMAAAIEHLVSNAGLWDAIHVEHLRGAEYGRVARQSLAVLPAASVRPVLVWDSVDCISHLFAQTAVGASSLKSRLMARLELARTRRYERAMLDQFDKVIVTSAADRQALLDIYSLDQDEIHSTLPAIHVVANGVDLAHFAPPAAAQSRAASRLVVSGKMSYHANVTMVKQLVEQIMPLVWAAQPDIELSIVGKNPPADIVAYGDDERITVTGFVPDIAAELQTAAVAVAPVMYAAGIQNKVLEAMACATPTVVSSTVLGGIAARPDEEICIADNAPDFASQILELLADDDKRGHVGHLGRQYVERNHDWGSAVQQLEAYYTPPHTPPLLDAHIDIGLTKEKRNDTNPY